MLDPRGNDTKPPIPDNGPADETSRMGGFLGTDRHGRSAGAGSRPVPEAGQARRWGSCPGRLGVLTIIVAAFAGAVVTAISGQDPGLTLGVFIIAGTAIAATIVRLRSVYTIFPVPALAYVAAAVITGLIHDRATDTSDTGLTLNGVQWIAAGFKAMTTATILAIVVAAGRWLWRRWATSRNLTGRR
jgi:Domain of unknown function (DUF6542)